MYNGGHDDTGSHGQGNPPLGVGITLEDLRCPICVETIKDPFVTTCGHTFCFTCITTHLRNKRSCPSCSVYITQDSIHPNFLLNKISHKASTINPRTPSSLLDHVTHLLATNSPNIKVHDVQQVIEFLEVTKAQLQQQETTNNMELLLLFLQHARSQKEQQLQQLQCQMKTLERDLSTARQRCDQGSTATAAGCAAQQQAAAGAIAAVGGAPPQPLLLASVATANGVMAVSAGTGPTSGLPTDPHPPMLQPPPIQTISAAAYSHLHPDPAHKPNLLPGLQVQTASQSNTHLATTSYLPAISGPQPSTSAAQQPNAANPSASGAGPAPQGTASVNTGSAGHAQWGSSQVPPPAGTSGPVGFRPYSATSGGTPRSPSIQLAANQQANGQPARQGSSTSSISRPTIVASNPASNPPASEPRPAPPSEPIPKESAPSSSGAQSMARTVTGPEAAPSNYPMQPPPPQTAANEALRTAKRRRIMMQFDELQQCYLRLRHTGNAQEAAAPANGVGAVVEDDSGLDLFTQMLCAATHFAKLAVVAELPRSTSRPAILSSIEFDMDEQLFATAGVTQKISVYDFATIMADPKAQHSPVVEIPARSKLSCISWSPSVRHNLISSDYEGIVQLWDVAARTSVQEFEAHERRIWSVDFSPTEAQYFASGSDDGKVKVWSTNDPSPAINIDVKANVCSVQYNPQVSHSLAVGSANHSVLLYDLRKARDPLATYSGHRKAVSYVRFVNSHELVSASTDSTLRLWDTRANVCARTFTGHGNEKNFVGLSVDGEFIACGSETNRVYVYYKAIPKPTMYHSFSPGGEADVSGHFVTSVCWKRGYNHLVAANSSGSIWIMSLVD